MKKTVLEKTILLLLILPWRVWGNPSFAIETVKPALVRIHTVNVDYSQGQKIRWEGIGSGVIITPEGHIITNYHVAGKAERIICTLFTGEEIKAKLVGSDPLTDICIIKLLPEESRIFPFAIFGDSSKLKVGEPVLAMGSPYAVSQSATMGIVSTKEMVIPKLFWPFKFTVDGEDVGSIVRWIGHDAQIYKGSSGGPLVNLKGEIVGINEIRFGISAAIPGNLAKWVADEIITHGRVRRSWIGLNVQPLLKSSSLRKGVLVSGVKRGSPAQKAGILPGDILLRIGGKEVNCLFYEELPIINQILMGLSVEEEIEAVVLRNGKELKMKVTPVERGPIRPRSVELREWGITVRNISPIETKGLRRGSEHGVIVTSTRPGGPAEEAEPKILEGDVIIEVDGVPVEDVDDILKISKRLTKEKENTVPVLVGFERNGENLLTVVRIGRKDGGRPIAEAPKAWLPIKLQVVTKEMAERLGIKGRGCVRITQVYPGEEAEGMGLKVGDLILAINGREITPSYPEDIEWVYAMIRGYKIGSWIELTLRRGEKEFKVKVKLGKTPRSPHEMKRWRWEEFGFVVRDISFMDRIKNEWGKEEGVIVEVVDEGSLAAIAHLGVGDLIVKVNGKKIKNLDSFKRMIEKAERDKPFVFQIIRGVHTLFIELGG